MASLDIIIRHEDEIIANMHNCKNMFIDTDAFKSVKSRIDGMTNTQTVELEV
jgi:hypothetical protein